MMNTMVALTALLGAASAVPHSGAGKVEVKFFAEAVSSLRFALLSAGLTISDAGIRRIRRIRSCDPRARWPRPAP